MNKETGGVMWQMAPSLEPTNHCNSIDCTRRCKRNLQQKKDATWPVLQPACCTLIDCMRDVN
jgi:hypothetical protein